jgi:hypothetical protein
MNRRGVALLMAVAAVFVLGMIVLSGFALARAERSAGLASVAEVQASGAAEAALADALAGWPGTRTPVFPGQESALVSVQTAGSAYGEAWVRNLGGPIFAVRASGVRLDAAGQPLARSTVELLVRLDSTNPDSLIHPRKVPLGWLRFP